MVDSCRPNVGSVWRHYKGEDYRVVAVARSCEAPTRWSVVYTALYASHDFPLGTTWVRELRAWREQVLLPTGLSTPRFVRAAEAVVRRVGVVILGIGHVGCDLIKRIVGARALHAARHGLALDVVALGDSKGVLSGNWTDDALLGAIEVKARGGALGAALGGARVAPTTIGDFLAQHARVDANRVVLVDCSCGAATTQPLLEAMEKGHSVVLANKVPLSGSQAMFDAFQRSARRLRCESTVGAGLPVHAALGRLLGSGDAVLSVEGAFSGTLGFIASALGEGALFSAAVREARDLGYTEPDPRDDLSGVDVGRKALILARLLGLKIASLDEVQLEGLFPAALSAAAGLSVDAFLERLDELDAPLAARVAAAQAKGCEVRYTARVDVAAENTITVGLAVVPRASALGSLRGSANLVTFETGVHPAAEPLVIKGAGAGAGVTSTGVLADIIELALLM
jgi:homoserine dehydrogenase